MDKTVYFLGAGFSKEAGGPVQNEIIKTLLSNSFKKAHAQNHKIARILNHFTSFLSKELCLDKNDFEKVSLEDIFTPIDSCIANGKSFGAYTLKTLSDFKEQLHTLMALAIQHAINTSPESNKNYIKKFAQYVNSEAKKRLTSLQEDNISLITTNWDTLLDNQLYNILQDQKGIPLSVVDYCCYISSLEEDDENIKPGLLALGEGGYNIKYLKLHGSMNWLHCPMCQRMYVKFNTKALFEDNYCRHCMKNYKMKKDQPSIKLKGNLLLPTFLKDLSNIQIKLVWQNAGIELSEASKIVFIGYSLPSADFEIRQLLSRYVRKNAEIQVVIYDGHNSSRDKKRINEEKRRYKYFFGNRIKEEGFILKSTSEYIESL